MTMNLTCSSPYCEFSFSSVLFYNFSLGKTIQVIAFLSGMFDMQNINSVLIVLPVALMVNWENEFKKW